MTPNPTSSCLLPDRGHYRESHKGKDCVNGVLDGRNLRLGVLPLNLLNARVSRFLCLPPLVPDNSIQGRLQVKNHEERVDRCEGAQEREVVLARASSWVFSRILRDQAKEGAQKDEDEEA